tara:strand:- start:1574 stop:2254 length:681 start_codon:yes stop_codon:yes gene_type:complete
MKKKIFLFFLVLILLAITFNKKILTFIFVKKISHWTEYKAELEISKFDYFEGILEISQLKLKNKDGFSYENFFESNQVIINFDYKSLFSDLVIINDLNLIDPKVYLEIKNANNKKEKITNNLNLVEISPKKDSPKVYPVKKKDKNFIIKNLLIKNSKALINYSVNEKNLKINLSQMSFKKVGNAGNKTGQKFQHYKDVLKIILSDIFFRIPDDNLRNIIKKTYKIE